MNKLACIALLAISNQTLSQEWNFNTDKVSTGAVTISDEYGNDLSISANTGDLSGTSYSTIPLIVAEGAGGSGIDVQMAIRLDDDTVSVYEGQLNTWIVYEASDFESKFDYDSYSSVTYLAYEKKSNTVNVPLEYEIVATGDGVNFTASVDCTGDGARKTASGSRGGTVGTISSVTIDIESRNTDGDIVGSYGCAAALPRSVSSTQGYEFYVRAWTGVSFSYINELWNVGKSCSNYVHGYSEKKYGVIGESTTLNISGSATTVCSASAEGFIHYSGGEMRGVTFNYSSRGVSYYTSYFNDPNNPVRQEHTLSINPTSSDKGYLNTTTKELYFQDSDELYLLEDTGTDLEQVHLFTLESSSDQIAGFYNNPRVAE